VIVSADCQHDWIEVFPGAWQSKPLGVSVEACPGRIRS
jgi:hypothetical protein